MIPEHRPRILVVDDQSNWQRVLEDTLQHEGYEVKTASSRDEALGYLDSFSFQLAVIDVRLVDRYSFGVQGLKILEAAKRKGCRAIVLTGFAAVPGLRDSATKMGADCFLEKESDFNVDSFREIVASLIARQGS